MVIQREEQKKLDPLHQWFPSLSHQRIDGSWLRRYTTIRQRLQWLAWQRLGKEGSRHLPYLIMKDLVIGRNKKGLTILGFGY